jgi:hypothetical protein
MVIAFALGDDSISFFIAYCVMPLFIFLLTYTLAIRERDTKLHLREIVQNILRKVL